MVSSSAIAINATSVISRPGDVSAPPRAVSSRLPEKRPGQEGGRRDENRRQKTLALADAALGAMLERGVLAVTVDEIAAAAGVAKGSFYRYFDAKEQLVEALLRPLSDRLDALAVGADRAIGIATTEDELLAAYRTLADGLQSVLLAHPREVLLYLQESRGPAQGDRRPIGALAKRVSRMAIELTERAHEHRLLRPLDPRVSALAVVGAAERLVFEVLTFGSVTAPLEAAQALVTMVMEGLWNPDRRHG